MANEIPYTPPPGTLATLICVEFDIEDVDKPLSDYADDEIFEIDVIFDDNSMPCDFEKVDGRYHVGLDIYTSGIMPMQIKTIHKVLEKGTS